MRGLVVFFLALWLSQAYAQPQGNANASCSSPNNVAGAFVTPANVSCSIVAAYTGTWQFTEGRSGPNYELRRNGSPYGIPPASRAELCANTGSGYSPYVGVMVSRAPRAFTGTVSTSSSFITKLNFNPVTAGIVPGTPISGTGVASGAFVLSRTPVAITMNLHGTENGPASLVLANVPTYEAMTPVYGYNLQGSAICSPARGYFINATTSKHYDTAEESIGFAGTTEWRAPPSGLIWGQNGNGMATAYVKTAGATVAIDAGFIENGVSAKEPPGHDPINIGASNVTIRGASSKSVLLENNSGGGDDAVGQIDVFPGNAGITLSGMTLTWGDQNINFGGDNGAITINDVRIWFGGVQGRSGVFGQQHNIYLSNHGAIGNDGPVRITGLQSYDVQTGGYLFKDRLNNTTITASYFGCTLSPSTAEPGCEMNTPIDFPCGGNQVIKYSVIERNMVEADTQGSAPVMVRYGEEVNPTAVTCSEAVGTGYATNRLVLDHDIIINDAPPWHGYSQPWYVVQMGCNWHTTGMNCTCVVSNSIIVSNDSAIGADGYRGLSIAGGAGVSGNCADGGGNTIYGDRAEAAAALGWTGNDQFGNPCCAFPWQPTHLPNGRLLH